MPRPLTKSQRYMPGLDGVRAIAVLAVIGYHLGLSWIPGGLLGVGVFFTLSGYLITDLLLAAWERSGHLQLKTFWAHRARRLLPALFVMLPVVVLWVAVAEPAEFGAVRAQALAAAVYVGNWWLIAQHVSYFARFGPPSPLGHLWSLAVEEQFYLIWPWLLAIGLAAVTRWRRHRRERPVSVPVAAVPVGARAGVAVRAGVAAHAGGGAQIGGGAHLSGGVGQADLRALGNLLSGRTLRGETDVEPAGGGGRIGGERGRSLGVLAVATLVLAAGSAVEMAALYHPSFDPSRVYDGTDTRAFGLLIGAALAMVWPSRGLTTRIAPRARALLDAVGVVGLLGIGVLMWQTTQYSPFLYPDGMVLLSVATVMVVAAVAHPATWLGRALGWRPLRWVGSRSYAIYLWHYPVIVLTDPGAAPRPNAGRDLAQLAVTLVLAELSWRLVETPVRAGGVADAWARWRIRPRRGLAGRPGLVLSVAAGAVVLGLAAVAVLPNLPSRSSTAITGASGSQSRTARAASGTTMPAAGGGHRSGPSGDGKPAATAKLPPPTAPPTSSSPGTTVPSATTTDPAGSPAVLRTRCTSVVHIGDSTSESLVSSSYLPDPAQRLPAEYAKVGATHSIMEIQGGTSIVETIGGQPNAYDVARSLVRGGYKGCWVIALGTNDAADVYVGSNVSFSQRIQRMMSVIGHQPVLWVNTVSQLASGPYAESNMQRWDQDLLQACRAHPNMAVFDWSALAQRSWFIADGIHYTSEGSAKRAAAIADALAAAFPASGPSAGGAGCLVKAAPNWDLPSYQS